MGVARIRVTATKTAALCIPVGGVRTVATPSVCAAPPFGPQTVLSMSGGVVDD